MLVRASTTLTGLNYAKKIKLKDSIGNETDRPKTAYCVGYSSGIAQINLGYSSRKARVKLGYSLGIAWV